MKSIYLDYTIVYGSSLEKSMEEYLMKKGE